MRNPNNANQLGLQAGATFYPFTNAPAYDPLQRQVLLVSFVNNTTALYVHSSDTTATVRSITVTGGLGAYNPNSTILLHSYPVCLHEFRVYPTMGMSAAELQSLMATLNTKWPTPVVPTNLVWRTNTNPVAQASNNIWGYTTLPPKPFNTSLPLTGDWGQAWLAELASNVRLFCTLQSVTTISAIRTGPCCLRSMATRPPHRSSTTSSWAASNPAACAGFGCTSCPQIPPSPSGRTSASPTRLWRWMCR